MNEDDWVLRLIAYWLSLKSQYRGSYFVNIFNLYLVFEHQASTAAQPTRRPMIFVKVVRFEVFTAVAMKNAVFWEVAPCTSYVNRRSSETLVHTRSTWRHIREDGILRKSC
jgi:hypothetical protein